MDHSKNRCNDNHDRDDFFIDLIKRQLTRQLLDPTDNLQQSRRSCHLQHTEQLIRAQVNKSIDRGISDALIIFIPTNYYSSACIQSLLNSALGTFGYSHCPLPINSDEEINLHNIMLPPQQRTPCRLSSDTTLNRIAFVSGYSHDVDTCVIRIANQLIVRDESIRDHVQALDQLQEHFKVSCRFDLFCLILYSTLAVNNKRFILSIPISVVGVKHVIVSPSNANWPLSRQ